MTPPLQRIALSTGVELDVAIAGDPAHPPVILLHGFPESHRTWRGIIPDLARDHYVVAPDQRGFARSSKPDGVAAYTADAILADLIALADHLKIDRFTLVGHDWGGAIAWMAALTRPDRVARLVIVNAPHPFLFQRALFDEPEQRKASQYITRFRDTTIDQGLTGAGLEKFLGSTFAHHVTQAISGADKAAYLDEWSQPGAMTAMLNWYRASGVIVPAMDEDPPRPPLPRQAVSAGDAGHAGRLGHARCRAAAGAGRRSRPVRAEADGGEDRRGAFRAVGETRCRRRGDAALGYLTSSRR